MFRRNRRSWLRASLLALAVVAVPTLTAANHSWGSYHWARTSNPFTVGLGDNVTRAWDGYLSTTSADWTASVVLDAPVVAGGAKGGRNCRPDRTRVEVCNGQYGNNGWLGIAQIWVSGAHITQGAVKVNDTYFNTATYNTPAWRNLVMCQEVGHVLGLDHQDEDFDNANLGTCMDYTSDPSSNQHPNQHDYEQLDAIYAHLDATSTLASTTSAAPGNSPASWGQLVRGSPASGTSLYALELGGGNRLLTHVFWTR